MSDAQAVIHSPGSGRDGLNNRTSGKDGRHRSCTAAAESIFRWVSHFIHESCPPREKILSGASGSSAPYVRRLDLYHAPRSKVGSQTATPRGKNSEQAPPTERLVVTLKRRTGSGGTVARPESVRASARAQNAETVEKSLRQIDRFFGAFSTHPGFPVPNRPDFDRLRSDFRDAVGEVFAARLRRLERPEE